MGQIRTPEPQIMTPKTFANKKAQYADWREQIFRRVVRISNTVLNDLAGNKDPRFNKDEARYVEWLRQPENGYYVKDAIIVSLGSLSGSPLDRNLLTDLRQLFIDAGWGEKTKVIAQAPDDYDLWAIIEPVYELEDK